MIVRRFVFAMLEGSLKGAFCIFHDSPPNTLNSELIL
jgi:hypothetical protein